MVDTPKTADEQLADLVEAALVCGPGGAVYVPYREGTRGSYVGEVAHVRETTAGGDHILLLTGLNLNGQEVLRGFGSRVRFLRVETRGALHFEYTNLRVLNPRARRVEDVFKLTYEKRLDR